MSILFWLRRNQTNRKGECSLWCSISIQQSKAEFSCKLPVHPDRWNQQRQRAEGLHAEYINAHLEQITARLLEIKITCQAQGKVVTPQLIKDGYLGKTLQHPTFLQMYEKCMNRKTLAQASRQKYERWQRGIEGFLIEQRKQHIAAHEFTPDLMEEFEYYLKSTKQVKSQDYLYKYMDSIREVMRFCQKKQIPINSHTLHYQIKKGEPKVPLYLTEEQFERLRTFSHPNNHLIKARDLAIFQRYTGFAYADVMSFDYQKDTYEENGRRWIQKSRVKSDEVSLLPLFPEAVAILEKYGYELPKLSNQKLNSYLGTIGELIGLPFKLSTHILRKTAGALWLQQGVPYALVSKMLGHASITTTQRHYVRVDLSSMQAYFKG